MSNKTIDTRTARIWLDDDNNILHFDVLPGAEVVLEDTQEYVSIMAKLKKTPKVLLITDLRGVKSITRDSRVCLSSEETGNLVSACALLIGSTTSRVMGNFFLGLNKPPYPTRLFTSEAKASEWLKGFTAKKDVQET